jgi:hypothetical protein
LKTPIKTRGQKDQAFWIKIVIVEQLRIPEFSSFGRRTSAANYTPLNQALKLRAKEAN